MYLGEVNQLINDYGDLKITKKQLYSQLDCATYRRVASEINKAEKIRSKIVRDKNMQVVYLTGGSGSGKTVFAKYWADKLHFDYFVSGGNNDILDGYDREECIILDDFRASTMSFPEFIKMIDNNTNSSVTSRYYNKDVSNCKLVIITSIVSPQQTYLKFLADDLKKEPPEQFYRRLHHVYYEIQDNGDIREKVTDTEAFTGRKLANIFDVFNELGINPARDKPEIDYTSVFFE